MQPVILLISHNKKQCGVYQYGLNIFDAIKKSNKYRFLYVECSSMNEYLSTVERIKPQVIIYNYYPSKTHNWLNQELIRKVKAIHIGIIHEISQKIADLKTQSLFQYYIAPDPTLELKNPIVFKTSRIIPEYNNMYDFPVTPTIGSFGFGTAGKGFERLIAVVQNEFEEAIINLHIPYADFGDNDGKKARSIAERCLSLVKKPGIIVKIKHDFLSQKELLDFLAKNSINAFFYDQYNGRGISSVIDFALAVKRPIAITNSKMFRHIISAEPSIFIEESSLRQIMNNGLIPLLPYYSKWNEKSFMQEYENIVEIILSHSRKIVFGMILYRARFVAGKFFSKIVQFLMNIFKISGRK